MLIVGDVGSGKTLLTANFLDQTVDKGYAPQVTVIDMAPPAMKIQGVMAGGTLADFTKSVLKVRYLKPVEVKAPRLTAKTSEELKQLAEFNRQIIEPLLTKFLHEPTPFLFINDVSIYLQAGGLEKLLKVIRKAQTFIANGYLGRKLEEDFGTGTSNRERDLMNKLLKKMDVVIKLP